MKEDKYGINIEQYCRDHEKYIEKHLAAGDDLLQLLNWHEKKLSWIQHERLVHLIVMVMSVAVELVIVLIVLFHPETWPWSAVIMLGWMILVVLYIRHYFVLENTVQHWYRIAEELHNKIIHLREQDSNSGSPEDRTAI